MAWPSRPALSPLSWPTQPAAACPETDADLPGVVVVVVVVVWWPWPDEDPDDPAEVDPVDELVFVCPGDVWLWVRPGPEPPARTPLPEPEAGLEVVPAVPPGVAPVCPLPWPGLAGGTSPEREAVVLPPPWSFADPVPDEPATALDPAAPCASAAAPGCPRAAGARKRG